MLLIIKFQNRSVECAKSANQFFRWSTSWCTRVKRTSICVANARVSRRRRLIWVFIARSCAASKETSDDAALWHRWPSSFRKQTSSTSSKTFGTESRSYRSATWRRICDCHDGTSQTIGRRGTAFVSPTRRRAFTSSAPTCRPSTARRSWRNVWASIRWRSRRSSTWRRWISRSSRPAIGWNVESTIKSCNKLFAFSGTLSQLFNEMLHKSFLQPHTSA